MELNASRINPFVKCDTEYDVIDYRIRQNCHNNGADMADQVVVITF